MRERRKALDELREYQRQLDPEGIEVGVSRQALDETLDRITELEAQVRSADKIYGQQSIELSRALDTIEQQRSRIAKLEQRLVHVGRSGDGRRILELEAVLRECIEHCKYTNCDEHVVTTARKALQDNQ